MKLRIKGKKTELITTLHLHEDAGDVDVVATNKKGDEQVIVSFLSSTGKLFLYEFQSDVDLGFKQNKAGQILIVK